MIEHDRHAIQCQLLVAWDLVTPISPYLLEILIIRGVLDFLRKGRKSLKQLSPDPKKGSSEKSFDQLLARNGQTIEVFIRINTSVIDQDVEQIAEFAVCLRPFLMLASSETSIEENVRLRASNLLAVGRCGVRAL